MFVEKLELLIEAIVALSFFEWAIILAVAAYIAYSAWVGKRLAKLYLGRSEGKQALELKCRWQGRVLLRLVPLGGFLSALFFFAPRMHLYFRRKLKEKKEAEWQEECRAREAADNAKQEENVRRRARRKEWFKENPPVLYYNVIAGLYVVVTPQVYEEARRQTIRCRTNGTWSHAVLMPASSVYLFLREEGRAALESRLGSDPFQRCKAGWLMELHDIARRYGAEMKQKRDLFVPYVGALTDQVCDDDLWRSFEKAGDLGKVIQFQAPESMWPLR